MTDSFSSDNEEAYYASFISPGHESLESNVQEISKASKPVHHQIGMYPLLLWRTKTFLQ